MSFGEFVSLCSACFRCRKISNRLKEVLWQFGRDESKANALETLGDADPTPLAMVRAMEVLYAMRD